MEKICHDWESLLPPEFTNGEYWQPFLDNATAVSSEVNVIKTYDEALKIIKDVAKEAGFKKIAALSGEENEHLHKLYQELSKDFTVLTDKFEIAKNADCIDLGITTGEFGVGETGSILVDNYAYENRIASMLSTMNIVFIKKNLMVKDMEDAFAIMGKVFDKGYTGFVTGPSRTSDIERVLTLGVHGPKRFMIMAMED